MLKFGLVCLFPLNSKCVIALQFCDQFQALFVFDYCGTAVFGADY